MTGVQTCALPISKYENRLKEWEKEKEEKLIQLQHKIQEKKNQQLIMLRNSLKIEKEKAAAQEERRIADLISKKEKMVIADSVKFSAQFLKPFTDAELENKILGLLLDSLLNLPPEKIKSLKKEADDYNQEVQIQSAFQLTTEQKNKISLAIEKIFGYKDFICTFTLNPELLAGFLINIGSVILDANLKNELKLFNEAQMNG